MILDLSILLKLQSIRPNGQAESSAIITVRHSDDDNLLYLAKRTNGYTAEQMPYAYCLTHHAAMFSYRLARARENESVFQSLTDVPKIIILHDV